MARTFKFSFPLPRRKLSSDRQPSAPQRVYSDNAGDIPLSSPGAKAEEVLGTSASNSDGLGDVPRMNAIRKYPSFMSVTISDAGSDSLRGDDEVRSGMSTPGEGAYDRRSSLARNQPSSPLLGHFLPTVFDDRSRGSDRSSPQVHYTQSSTTLQPYYDPARSPLAVSQQTSASSVRDMALRKGMPIVSSPLAQDASQPVSPVDVGPEVNQDTAEPARRRPPHIDLSSLFPNPIPIDPPLNSPHLITRSPARMSLISSNHRSTSGRPKWFGWEKKKSRPSEVHDSQRLPSIPPPADDPPAYKLNVSKPGQPAHDNLKSTEQGASHATNGAAAEYGLAVFPQPPEDPRMTLRAGYDEISREWRSRPRNSSFGNYSQRSIASQRSTNLRLEPIPPQVYRQNGALPSNCEIRSNPSSASRPSIRSGNERGEALSTMDLLNQSVLSLSSSEDESEDSVPTDPRFHRHCIRESIDCADKGEETQVFNAQRVTSLKPRPVVSTRTRRRSKSSGSGAVPPMPTTPARPKLSPRVSSMKWQEHQTIGSALDNYADSGTFESADSGTGLRLSSLSKMNMIGSKMMAVTPDEEKLLEGMRRKRASIRQDVFAESFGKGAAHLEDSIARPRTAGAEGRTRFFDAEMSRAPPNVPDDLARSLSVPYAASVDDLTQDVDYAFPEVPDIPARLRGPNSLSSPPRQSPSLSFSVSDLVPSTPTSRRSPITPPPGISYLDAQSSKYVVSPSRPICLANQNKHERKRTVSSSVVVLDGAEQRAQQLDEEDEITGWAMNRW